MNKNHHNPFRNSETTVNNSRNSDNICGKPLGGRFKSPSDFQPKKDSRKFNKFSKRNQSTDGTNNSNPDELNDKEKEWGKVKFNPIAATATEGNATPWFEFKREMLKNGEQESKANQNAANNDKRGQHSREQLYKKKIAELQNLPTPKWEDFGETNTPKKYVKRKRSKAGDSKSVQSQSALIDEDCLRNFDSKKLNFAQNNKLRKIITSATMTLNEQGSLRKILKGLKHRKKREQEIKGIM